MRRRRFSPRRTSWAAASTFRRPTSSSSPTRTHSVRRKSSSSSGVSAAASTLRMRCSSRTPPSSVTLRARCKHPGERVRSCRVVLAQIPSASAADANVTFGVHVHVATGYALAAEYAERIGCNAVQFFSGSPKTYRTAPPDEAALSAFRDRRAAAGIEVAVIHTPYLINLASDDKKVAAGSFHLLKHDLAVAAKGGIQLVNTHLGSYG